MIRYQAEAEAELDQLAAHAPRQCEQVIFVIELADRYAKEGRTPLGRRVVGRPDARRLIAGSYHVYVQYVGDGSEILLVLQIEHMRLRRSLR